MRVVHCLAQIRIIYPFRWPPAFFKPTHYPPTPFVQPLKSFNTYLKNTNLIVHFFLFY